MGLLIPSLTASADRIFLGGVIWTGAEGGPTPPEGRGLATAGERILAVGPAREILRLRGPRTEIHDLQGGALFPGFVDAHVHLLSGGLELARLNLRAARSPQDFRELLNRHAQEHPGEGWLLGGGWDQHRWGGALPHRAWLDAAAPGRAVFLVRTDLHVGVASTEALRRAGFEGVEGPEGWEPLPSDLMADRDPLTGALTGVLRESAMDRIWAALPPLDPGDREAALRRGIRHALSRGVTQLHDKGVLQNAPESWASLDSLASLDARGELALRVSASVPLSEREALAQRIQREGRGTPRLRQGSVKAFVDGSLGAGTAWFLEDYTGQPGWRGGPVTPLEPLAQELQEAVALGLQPIVHAIGDAATEWLTGVYERLGSGARSLRPRMEHVQHITPELPRRLARAGIIASMQPAHLTDDGPWATDRIGEARMVGAFAIRALQEAGVALAFGSDWTVAPLDPWTALEAAITRRIGDPAEGGGRIWGPASRIGLPAALEAHTLGAARAAFMEAETGSLAPGKRADLALVYPSPFEVEPTRLSRDVKVLATFVDGEPVWEDSADGQP